MGDFVANLVSTIIPVHNRPELLREAVESVLAQTHWPIEIIIVDDGSTDDTTDVTERFVRRYPELVRVIHQGRAGPGSAREAGRRVARGEFIQYLDSDDVLMPTKFEAQVEGLRLEPACGVSYGQTWLDKNGMRPWKRTGERIETMFPSFLQSRWWDTLTPLYRRAVVDRAGPWLALWQEEDWEYDCRIAAQGIRLHYHPECVAVQRTRDRLRLSGGGLPAERAMRDRAVAHRLIFQHARRAGITPEAPEMQWFSRELFLLARQAGALGLAVEAQEFFELARQAAGPHRGRGRDFALYQTVAQVIGWTAAGRLAIAADRLPQLRRLAGLGLPVRRHVRD